MDVKKVLQTASDCNAIDKNKYRNSFESTHYVEEIFMKKIHT